MRDRNTAPASARSGTSRRPPGGMGAAVYTTAERRFVAGPSRRGRSTTPWPPRIPVRSLVSVRMRGVEPLAAVMPTPEGNHMLTPSEFALNAAVLDDASLSTLARGMVGSEVLRIAAEVRAAIAAGREVCNLTVGDFDPREFPLPRKLADGIRAALEAGHTNYPPSNGVPELRKAVVEFYRREMSLDYPLESVIVAGGARPLIYATYRALVDPGEAVVFPVPSWNNNHYAYLTGARTIPLEVRREHAFHPTVEQVAAV